MDLLLNEESLKDYPDLLDVKQVKEILQIGRDLVYQLINENKIANHRIGRKTLIPKAGVVNYLNSLFFGDKN